jgi:hypothetical protein
MGLRTPTCSPPRTRTALHSALAPLASESLHSFNSQGQVAVEALAGLVTRTGTVALCGIALLGPVAADDLRRREEPPLAKVSCPVIALLNTYEGSARPGLISVATRQRHRPAGTFVPVPRAPRRKGRTRQASR